MNVKTIILIITLFMFSWAMRPIYNEPVVYKNFITSDECEYIKRKAVSRLKRSTVSEDYTIDDKIRKSETAWLTRKDPIIDSIIKKCVALTNRPVENCEDLQVLRYTSGGFYKPHQDVDKKDDNYRMYTVLLCLNDDFTGGETSFPNLKKEYKLRKGDALFFNTVNNYHMMTDKAIHGGKPVKSGEKWVCNLWVRKFEY